MTSRAEGRLLAAPVDTKLSNGELRATLAAAVHEAESHVSAAEASVALLDARILMADAVMAKARAVLASLPGRIEQGPLTLKAHMSIEEFATEMGVSKRKVQYDLKEMTEGVHFHRHGRRVILHGPEAAALVRARRQPTSPSDDTRLVIDELTRRRAASALKTARARGTK